MTGTTTRRRSPWLRWSVVLATALLTASCGSDGDAGGANGGSDAGGAYDGGGSTPSETVLTVTLEDYQADAREACSILAAPIADDPTPYAAAAATLTALDTPTEPGEAEAADRLAEAMQGLVRAHTDLTVAIEAALPGFEVPPGTWFLTESGAVYASESGDFADVSEVDLPADVGTAFNAATEELDTAATSAGVPECAPLQVQQ